MELKVACIKSIKTHPEAHKLKICQVFDGDASWEVVCGASNAREGLLTIFAAAGSQLPQGKKIQKTNLRGIDSYGMLCSPKDLGSSGETGLIDLPAETTPGTLLKDIDPDQLSSTPWYSYQEVEIFWEDEQKQIHIERESKTVPGKLLSKTYYFEGAYFYRNYLQTATQAW